MKFNQFVLWQFSNLSEDFTRSICFMKVDVQGTNEKKGRKEEHMVYLVINEFGPETSQGSLVRIRRQDGVVVPGLIDVLNNHKGLC